ncbi:MAG: efflux RND transporter permease subunit [Cyclobacteriaceae bacterium]|nr:efflux RND transporter permease subunit [Cyclobacteriaceae bacterium]
MENQQNKKQITREFGLSSLAINNKTSVLIITFIIVIMGLYSYVSIPKESFPDVVIPYVYVGTPYPGNSPVDIENLITRPIEKELKSISGIKNIKSTSVQDYSTIIVEFNPDEDIAKALQDVKDGVDRAKTNLPTDLDSDPSVMDIDLTEMPVMYINISGDYSINELKTYAEYLEDEFEKLPEVSKCEIKGALDREIRVDADIFKMEAVAVSFNDISKAISAENVTLSGGDILANEFRRSLRVDGEFKTVDDINNVIVKDEDQRIVYVKDVATVTDSYKERSSFSRSNRQPVVTVDVVKRNGENLLETAAKVRSIIELAKIEKLPDDITITITNDQSKYTKNMVSNLENSIISGVILVTLVLMFFMGLRNAMFVGIAIPLSMFMSFMLLQAIGYSANMMVLFGLILALGMLVDNGIVVIENTYRLLQQGYSPIRAAKEGVGEVAVPIITSTATTLAAFLPLAFWTGIMGEFMKYLPITLIIVLSSSLFVALVINPALAAWAMRAEEKKTNNRKLFVFAGAFFLVSIPFYLTKNFGIANLLLLVALGAPFNVFVLNPGVAWFQYTFLPWMERAYSSTLFWALKGLRPYLVFFGMFALLFVSIGWFFNSGTLVRLFPDSEPNYINIFIEKPIGYDIEETNGFTKKVEDEIVRIIEPYKGSVESFIAQVGEGASDPNQMAGAQETPNKSMITISFVEYEFRNGVDTRQVMEEIRKELVKYPGVQITIDKEAMGPPVGKPINLEVSGENYEKLIRLSEDVMRTINEAGIEGIQELKSDLETGKPELLVNIDRDKAQRFGLSTLTIASELRTALFGLEISKFKEGEDEYPIQLRLKDEYRYDIDALMNKRVTFRDNKGNLKQIPISAVASLEYSSSYGSVKRKDLDRVISIYSNVVEGYNANEIISDLKLLLADYDTPDGYTLKFTGEQEEQAETSEFLMRALLIAVFSIYLIIVAQFNSFSSPLIIMASVLLSTIGVFLGLATFKMDFVIIMTGIGIISLAGVVVNNAIVLIDYTNLVRNRRRLELGLEEGEYLSLKDLKESIRLAGQTRLRPVLLTAITTVLGLIPMALGMNIDYVGLFTDFNPHFYMGGDNANFWGPMAWTVIFGLTFATFLTLVVVPIMYFIVDKISLAVQGVKHEE